MYEKEIYRIKRLYDSSIKMNVLFTVLFSISICLCVINCYTFFGKYYNLPFSVFFVMGIVCIYKLFWEVIPMFKEDKKFRDEMISFYSSRQ